MTDNFSEKESEEKNKPLDTGLICLVLAARFHDLPADPDGLKHRFGPSEGLMSEEDMLRAAKALGLKAKAVDRKINDLGKMPLPALAQLKDGAWVVVGRADEANVLLQDPRRQGVVKAPLDEFNNAWSGRTVLLRSKGFAGGAVRKFNISWFIPAMLKYKHLFRDVLLASFFLQLFGLITPLFFQVILDKVLVHKAMSTLNVLAIGLLAMTVFEIVLGGLRTWLVTHTTSRVDVMLGAQLFSHLVSLPLAYFEARRVGDVVARVRELENVRRFLTGSALTVVMDLFFTIVFFAVMFFYSAKLTLIVLGITPFYVLLALMVTPMLQKRLNEKFKRGAESQAFLVEAINGIQALKSMAVEPRSMRRWEDMLAGYVKAGFSTENLSNIASQATNFLSKLSTILILWVGAQSVIDGNLSVGQLIAFNMMSGRTTGPILRLSRLWQDFQQAGISLKRLGDILNVPTEPGYNPNHSSLPEIRGKVVFEQIRFRYRPDGPYILQDVDLTIPAGQVVGVVGRSGSGKSTLAKLLQRLYASERGRVLVDGQDLSLVDVAWLRRQVGVVQQESMLFNMSVRENIALADPGAGMDEIIKAAQLAGAHNFISELPEGYDTMVGERGTTVSGGQKQRLAIARTLLTNPRLLIFDEATSALDYESEDILQRNMRDICIGRTVMIIAHRLSTVRGCDRIIVVDKGQIVEDGAHRDLVNTGGYYSKLWSYQSSDPQPIQSEN